MIMRLFAILAMFILLYFIGFYRVFVRLNGLKPEISTVHFLIVGSHCLPTSRNKTALQLHKIQEIALITVQLVSIRSPTESCAPNGQ